LIDGGIDLNSGDGTKQANTALHYASSFGDSEVVELLCRRGSNVNARNSDGATPLHDAVSRGQGHVLSAPAIATPLAGAPRPGCGVPRAWLRALTNPRQCAVLLALRLQE